jgi:hypothetical protein
VTSTRPVLVTAAPQLFVADITASCAFSTGKLGFETVFVYGEPPFYAQVAGGTFHQPLKPQQWGAQNFIVEDPDGNLLLFAGPAE